MENRVETLKALAAMYLPELPETVDGQRRLMKQLADVVPPVSICMGKAERETWAISGGEFVLMPQTLSATAADVQKIIGITIVENLKLEEKSEASLLMAWAAMDYYCAKLEGEPSSQLQKFRDSLTEVLAAKIDDREKREKMIAMMDQMEPAPEEPAEAMQPQEDPEESTVFMDFGQEEDTFRTMVQEEDPFRTEVQSIPAASVKEEPDEIMDSSIELKKKPKSKLPLVILGAVVLIAAVLAVLLFNKVGSVERAIDKLDEIDLTSEEAIAAAEESYNALSEEQQAKVENYEILVEARSAYECLVVEDAIGSIGKVTLESEGAIENAENLYEALPNDLKARVGNKDALKKARSEVDRMQKLVNDAAKAIDGIGEVSLDSGDKIAAARKAYDALAKDGLQSYVASKVSVLTKAEENYSNCKGAELHAQAEALFKSRKYEDALDQANVILKDFPNAPVAADAQSTAHACILKLAEQAGNKGDLYSAMKWLKQVQPGFTASEEYKAQLENIEKRLERARPKSGNKFSDKAGWGWCELLVTAGNEDVCVKIVSKEDNTKFTMVYVRSGESAEINLKDGSYTVYLTTGKNWYSKDVGFGDEASYQKVSESLNLTSWRSGSYVYYYRYDLNLRNSANSDFALVSSTADAFWG